MGKNTPRLAAGIFILTKPVILPTPITPSVKKTTKILQRQAKWSNGWDDWIWLFIAGLVIATLWFILFPPASVVGVIMPITIGMELGNLGIFILAAEAALALGLCAWVICEIAKWTFDGVLLDKMPSVSPEKSAQKLVSAKSAVLTPAQEPAIDTKATRGLNFWQKHAPTFWSGVPANDSRLALTPVLI